MLCGAQTASERRYNTRLDKVASSRRLTLRLYALKGRVFKIDILPETIFED